MPIERLVLLLLFCLIASPLEAHEKFMIGRGYPVPPPTVDPGPDAATLDITIKDRDTGRTVSAVVSVNDGAQEPDDNLLRQFSLRHAANRHKGPIRFRDLDYYFFTAGSFSVRVPPGRCKVEVSKGYEYFPVQRVLNLGEKEETEVVIYLQRWTDMAKQGWYSGDLHIHLERTGSNDDTILALTSAKDIKYGFILSMNTRGYDQGREFESWRQAKGLGDKSNNRKGSYHISSGQEYRPQFLGHVSIVMGDDYVPGLGRSENISDNPSLSLIADQAHQLNGYIGLLHGGYDHMEADRLGLEGKMDFLELFQFGGYRGLGLDGWYDFLNLGYRWPIVGSSDFPYTRELGDCITYVKSESTPSIREFVQHVSAGASFVTSGPMLFLEVNGRSPGESLRFPERNGLEVEVKVRVLSPLYPVRYVEIIQDSGVVTRKFAPQGKASWEFVETLPVRESGWIASRAYGDAGTDAHTNPVYLFVDGKRPFSQDAIDQILARLEGSMRTIPNVEILKHLELLAQRLVNYRDRGDATGLALPPLPAE
jgi:hypothetical protein